MSDRLVEIERKDWLALKELYKPGVKRSYIAYTLIDNYIRLSLNDPDAEHARFFCLNGDFSDGTFVAIDQFISFADTFNANTDFLFKLITLMDFSRNYVFLSLRSETQSTIVKAVETSVANVSRRFATLLYFCPKETALKFDTKPSDDIEMYSLTKLCDLEKVCSVWTHRVMIPDNKALNLLERMAKYNLNIGAFKDDGTLVAWIFRYSTGLLGVLQTDSNHFGHGYGTLVVKSISKKIAEMDHDIYAGVSERNYPSRNLFDRLGFKSVGEVHWITTKSNQRID